jgi:Holliday junction resolvase RusA-like endonuclease
MTEIPGTYLKNPTLKLTLTGRVIPKARPRHNGSQSYLPSGYRDWKASAIAELCSQYQGQPIPKAAIAITILGSARGDLDNLARAILDALVQSGVLKDNSCKCVPRLIVTHTPNKISHALIEVCAL